MDNSEAIILALGGTGAVASALEQSDSTVSGWRTRGIPAGHWAAVVALATECGRSDITLEVLAELAARRLKEPVPDEARA
jgi:hypothetical protein